MIMSRRSFLAGLGALGLGGCKYLPDDGLFNPCLAAGLPEHLREHPVIKSAWQSIDPSQVWDSHVHLTGIGDSDSGLWITPRMGSLWHPIEYVQYHAYMNAACIKDELAVDKDYVRRLLEQLQAMPVGVKAMLLAFDYHHDAQGRAVPSHSTFHTPNHYAAALAKQFPERFEWVASIHPYRPDAVEALYLAAEQGARAIKWLPPAMGIDPASKKCDGFYRALKELGIPIISHAGDEKAVHSELAQTLGNPLRLEYALASGVKVIVAHCASLGQGNVRYDDPQSKLLENFELFAGMMENQAYDGLLFGEISAITQINREPEVLRTLLGTTAWQHRLLNASDYPLPGIPVLFSLRYLRSNGFINEDEASLLNEVRQHNALLFDFLLKRSLRYKGKRFDSHVFHTKRNFESKSL